MAFRIVPSSAVLQGKLIYTEREYSFNFQPTRQADLERMIGDSGVTSLSISCLQIEVSVYRGRLLYVWGYHPWHRWERRKILVPDTLDGEVYFVSATPLSAGVSLGLEPMSANWRSLYDPGSGWIMITDTRHPTAMDLVRIAGGCVVGIEAAHLRAVCLRPEWLKQ